MGALGMWWDRFRGWPLWAQLLVWVVAWPVPLALLAIARPERRRAWTAAAAGRRRGVGGPRRVQRRRTARRRRAEAAGSTTTTSAEPPSTTGEQIGTTTTEPGDLGPIPDMALADDGIDPVVAGGSAPSAPACTTWTSCSPGGRRARGPPARLRARPLRRGRRRRRGRLPHPCRGAHLGVDHPGPGGSVGLPRAGRRLAVHLRRLHHRRPHRARRSTTSSPSSRRGCRERGRGRRPASTPSPTISAIPARWWR